MPDPIMADLTTRTLTAALDGTALQQRLAATNLANLETPGYCARRASFEDELRGALRAERQDGRSGAVASAPARVALTADAPRADGNNVSIEAEMTGLAEAGARYEVLTRLLDKHLAMIGVAIGDGRSA